MWHGVVLTIALSEMKALLITTLYKYTHVQYNKIMQSVIS